MTPAINKALPEFEAHATGGVKFTPAAFLGRIVVLYFYQVDRVDSVRRHFTLGLSLQDICCHFVVEVVDS